MDEQVISATYIYLNVGVDLCNCLRRSICLSLKIKCTVPAVEMLNNRTCPIMSTCSFLFDLHTIPIMDVQTVLN